MQSEPKSASRPKKYEPMQLVSMFKLAAELRTRMVAGGFTDNGGAIHSAERILNILGLRLCYPELSHINNLRKLKHAPFSEAARVAHESGQKVLIEHVNPLRALTRLAIEKLDGGMNDAEFLEFVRTNFKLALLTEEETSHLNKLNRSRLHPERLSSAGIRLFNHEDLAPPAESAA